MNEELSSREENNPPAAHRLLSIVTVKDLWEMEIRFNERLNKIMSVISDYAAKLAAFQDRQDKAIADLQTDVKAIQDALTQLNNNPGAITPADQALLDASLARTQAAADKLDALDAATPPPVPPTP